MATRFYLPSSGAAAVSPAFGSLWGDTEDADRIAMSTTPANTASSGKTGDEAVATEPLDVLVRQYVGPADLTAGSYSGTFRTVLAAIEDITGMDSWLQLRIAIYSSDGSTLRGDLFAGQTQTSESANSADPNYEFAGSPNNKTRILGLSMSPVTAQANDRLVVEYGFRCANSTTLNRTCTLRFGDPTASTDYEYTVDLDHDIAKRPWIEFEFGTTVQAPAATTTAQGLDATLGETEIVAAGYAAATAAGQAPSLSASQTMQPPAATATAEALISSATPVVPPKRFTPPTVVQAIDDHFWGRYGVPVGQSVVKKNGVYTTTPFPWLGELTGTEGTDWFLGGRTYEISHTVAAALIADGYTVTD